MHITKDKDKNMGQWCSGYHSPFGSERPRVQIPVDPNFFHLYNSPSVVFFFCYLHANLHEIQLFCSLFVFNELKQTLQTLSRRLNPNSFRIFACFEMIFSFAMHLYFAMSEVAYYKPFFFLTIAMPFIV